MAGTGAEFMELEEVDAVRMVWNVWPYSRLEAAKCVIPFSVMYTPAKQTSNLQVGMEAIPKSTTFDQPPRHFTEKQLDHPFILILNSYLNLLPGCGI